MVVGETGTPGKDLTLQLNSEESRKAGGPTKGATLPCINRFSGTQLLDNLTICLQDTP